jgi:hypothetical protein
VKLAHSEIRWEQIGSALCEGLHDEIFGKQNSIWAIALAVSQDCNVEGQGASVWKMRKKPRKRVSK